MRGIALALVLSLVAPGCLDSLVNGAGPVGPYDYIRDGEYQRWVIEVDHVAGNRPPAGALRTLEARLEEVVRKEDVVIQTASTALPTGDGTWTDDEVLALARETSDLKTGDGQVVTHVLYLDGAYDAGSGRTVFGIAYDYDVIAIFSESIGNACTAGRLCLDENRVQTAVLVHEFGHVLGLVNRGVPMQRDHQDEEHGAHSDNPESVMYYQVESLGAGVPFLSNIPTTFDADDKDDLCAAGGRC